ncbi:AP2/ERF family transcription factor [Nitrogeniibacter aestuarii]|uniref:AP2/ERF family transcription factor n=1 Tax=Nitrogeniibacter aestuarii TaxID=2815343 RepID=UPI001E32E612|nr:AP2/ERF family transcription factor [Nitrogeniibacter aestuarii]
MSDDSKAQPSPKPQEVASVNAMYCITYQATPGKEGYEARLRRRGKTHKRWFGKRGYGSIEDALRAAQQWRDKMITSLAMLPKREYVSKLRKNNTTGKAGIRRHKRIYTNKSGQQRCYISWVADPPWGIKASSRSFAVSKYGEEGALERAIEARLELEALCHGVHAPNVPRTIVDTIPQ